jgi:hypothetical protein
MTNILEELGVPGELQALFNTPDCIFDFGDSYEHFGKDFHKVPTTQNIWHVARDAVTDVIVTHSAMEALAYVTLNRHLYRTIDGVACVAIGNYPHNLQTRWIRETFRRRKITLVFGNCILGILADIKVATGLRALPVKMHLSEGMIQIECKGTSHGFDQDTLSLHVFEKAFGIRCGIRTRKPKKYITYLDELTAHENK